MPNKKYEMIDDVTQHYDRETADSRVVSDWIRTFKDGKLKVNGVPIGNFEIKIDGKPIGSFPVAPNEKDKDEIKKVLRGFFSDELLKKAKLTDENKEKTLNYFMKNLHQGGLLRIVSLSLGNMFQMSSGGPVTIGEVSDQSIDFQSTEEGFGIKESGKIKKLSFLDPKLGMQVDQPGGTLIDIQQSRVEIDFKNLYTKPEGSNEKVSDFEPTITQRECVINYGNESINQKLIARGLIKEIPKWENFHTNNTALTSERITTFKGNAFNEETFTDIWQKAIKQNSIKINGKLLNEHDVTEYDHFKTYLGIKMFVNKVMLKDFSEKEPGKKDEALAKLMTHLMQEGALSPVATGVKQLIKDNYELASINQEVADELEQYDVPGLSGIEMTNTLNIVGTADGVDMQEMVQVTGLTVQEGESKTRAIMPDERKNYLMKCQATLSLDLSGDELSVKVRNNTVSYGNKEISNNKKMDPRGTLHKILDVILRKLGINKVTHIAPEYENPTHEDVSGSKVVSSHTPTKLI